MADVSQVLATYDALVGVALGAGLTYGFGALNRRHQEQREDDTRWYEARFQAYTALFDAVSVGVGVSSIRNDFETTEKFLTDATNALARIRFIGSQEVIDSANQLWMAANFTQGRARKDKEELLNAQSLKKALMTFQRAARKDLGHPITTKRNAK